MSYEGLVTQLRRELVEGGRRRLRHERRRRAVAAVVCLLLVAGALSAAALSQRRRETQTASTAASVCTHYLEYLFISEGRFDGEVSAKLDQIGALAASSIDPAIASAAEGFADTSNANPRLGEALQQIRTRCKELRFDGFAPEYRLASPTAEVRVRLNDYGEVYPLDSERLTTLGRMPPQAAIGLRLVQHAANRHGGGVVYWTQEGRDGTRECVGVWTLVIGDATCGGREPEARALTSRNHQRGRPAAAYQVGSEVAFVVIDLGSIKFVQQPVFGFVVFNWDESLVVPENRLAARAYDADGNLLNCTGGGC